MKRTRIDWCMVGIIVAVAVVSLFRTASASASDGYVSGSGYSHNTTDGLWYRDGNAYERYRATCSRDGCCGKRVEYACWKYRRVIKHTDPDWREKLLDIAGQRDRHEAAERKSLREQIAFERSINALGIQGNFKIEGYGQRAFGFGGATGYAPNAQQGTTAYGYSKTTDIYNNAGLGVLYNQLGNAQQRAFQLTERVFDGTTNLAAHEGTHRARVATILANAEVARSVTDGQKKVIDAARPQGATVTETLNGTGTENSMSFTLPEVINARCASCHNAVRHEAASGSALFPDGADITKWDTWTLQQKERAAQLVESGDMPKSDDGEAEPLGWDESSLFYDAVTRLKGR